jgi:hypothetical protein
MQVIAGLAEPPSNYPVYRDHPCYVPILFDFEKPRSQTTDGTVTLLARMARFVIADISDAKSVLQELRAIVPNLPTIAVQPLTLSLTDAMSLHLSGARGDEQKRGTRDEFPPPHPMTSLDCSGARTYASLI